MAFTIGLTTIEHFEGFSFFRTNLRVSPYGRGQPVSGCPCESLISPLLSFINPSVFDPREEPLEHSRGRQIVPLWAVTLPAEASKPVMERKSHLCPVRNALAHGYRTTRRAEYHVSLIHLAASLGERRLECKRNFQRKRPQNRLRAQSVGRGRGPGFEGHRAPFRARSDLRPPLTPISRYVLNPLSIGAFPWRMHVIH
jgi:hypothetical protein